MSAAATPVAPHHQLLQLRYRPSCTLPADRLEGQGPPPRWPRQWWTTHGLRRVAFGARAASHERRFGKKRPRRWHGTHCGSPPVGDVSRPSARPDRSSARTTDSAADRYRLPHILLEYTRQLVVSLYHMEIFFPRFASDEYTYPVCTLRAKAKARRAAVWCTPLCPHRHTRHPSTRRRTGHRRGSRQRRTEVCMLSAHPTTVTRLSTKRNRTPRAARYSHSHSAESHPDSRHKNSRLQLKKKYTNPFWPL